MLTVSDDELPCTMFFIREHLKIIVEPIGARGKRVDVIFSGGNADLKNLARFL